MGASLAKVGTAIANWVGGAETTENQVALPPGIFASLEGDSELQMDKVMGALSRTALEFNNLQARLSRILNRGRPIIDKQPHLGHIKMPVAPRGKGRSTVCNVFENTSFPTGESLEDVTKCMEAKVFPDKVIVDTVGMDVTLENVGKIFLLFFIHGIFPDNLLLVDDTPRLGSIVSLLRFLKVGMVKACLVEFRAADYYREKERGRPEREAIARGAGFEMYPTAKIERLEARLARDPHDEDAKQDLKETEKYMEILKERNKHRIQYKSDLQSWLTRAGIASSCVSYTGLSMVLPVPEGSMREVFMRAFFDSEGHYKLQTYPEYIKGLEKRNMTEIMRGLMLQAVHILGQHSGVDHYGATSIPVKDWEVKFINDSSW
jgi:hypothetical protein